MIDLPPNVGAFLACLFEGLDPRGVHVASVPGDPNKSKAWMGGRVGSGYALREEDNLFWCVGHLDPDSTGRSLTQVAVHVALVFDDVGTKVTRERLDALRAFGFIPTSVVETSRGNFQYTFKLMVPVPEGDSEASQVLAAVRNWLATQNWGDPACFDAVRYMRLPAGVNGKPKYGGWDVRLEEFNPDQRLDLYAFAEFLMGPKFLADALSGKFVASRVLALGNGERRGRMDDPLVQLAAYVGLNPRPSSRAGVIDCTCPNNDAHTGGDDSGFAFINEGMSFCNHGSCAGLNSMDFKRMICAKYDAQALRDQAFGNPPRHMRGVDFMADLMFENVGIDPSQDVEDVKTQVREIKAHHEEIEVSEEAARDALDQRFIAVSVTEGFFDTKNHALVTPTQVDRDRDVVKVYPLGGKAKDRASVALINRGRIRHAVGLTRFPGAGVLVDVPNEMGLVQPMVNLYSGSGVGRRAPGPGLAAWLAHINLLFPPVEVEYYLSSTAYGLQFPHLPHPIITMMMGRPGIGKDSILAPIKLILGIHNVAEVSAADIMDKFNEWRTRRLIYMGEFNAHGQPGLHERLRDFTSGTPSWVTINPKFGRQYQLRTSPWFTGTCNNSDALHGMQAEDRRFFIMYSNIEPGSGPMTGDYFDKLNDILALPETLEEINEFLLSRDIRAFNPHRAPPKTASRHMIAVDSLPGPARAVFDEATGGLFAGRQIIAASEVRRFVESSRNNAINRPQAAHVRDGLTLAGCRSLGQIKMGGQLRESVWTGANLSDQRKAEIMQLSNLEQRTLLVADQTSQALPFVGPAGTGLPGPRLVADNPNPVNPSQPSA